MGRRNKNTFSKALGHLKSRKIDEKLQMLSERPANSTMGYMTIDPSLPNPDFVSNQRGQESAQQEKIPDFTIGENPSNAAESYDTSGLFREDGTILTAMPPGDTSYILGPMAAMWYAWANQTRIGYIRQADRKMQNLGYITGKLSDWDGSSSAFNSYGQMTLEQAQWFRTVQKQPGATNDPDSYNYRAYYPGPPSTPADIFGRYLSLVVGLGAGGALPGVGQPAVLGGTSGQQDPDSTFSALLDRLKNLGARGIDAITALGNFAADPLGTATDFIKNDLVDVYDKFSDTTLSNDVLEPAFEKFGQFIGSKFGFATGVAIAIGTDLSSFVNNKQSQFGDKPTFSSSNNHFTYAINLAMSLAQSIGNGRPVVMDNSVVSSQAVAQNISVDDIIMMHETNQTPQNGMPYYGTGVDDILNPNKDGEVKKPYMGDGFGGEGGSIMTPFIDNKGDLKISNVGDKTLRLGGESGEGFDINTQTFTDIPSGPSGVDIAQSLVESGKFANGLAGALNKITGANYSTDDAATVTNQIVNDPKYQNLMTVLDNDTIGGSFLQGTSTGTVNGAAGGALLYNQIKVKLGIMPESDLQKAGGYGHVRRETIIDVNDLKPEVQDKLNELYNLQESYSKKILSESRKANIIKNLKKPVVLPETKQKSYKVKPKIRTLKTVVSKPVATPEEYKPPMKMWGRYEYNQNVRASQERKNEVMNLLGEGEAAMQYRLKNGTTRTEQEMKEFWGKHPELYDFYFNNMNHRMLRKEQVEGGDFVVFLVAENGTRVSMSQSKLNEKLAEAEDQKLLDEYNKLNPKSKPISYEKDPLFKKVSSKLRPVINYPKKPSPKGYPDKAPPKLVNGFHPDLGKRYKYDKLDPQSAEFMPNQGNPEIDANIEKFTDKNVKIRKIKNLIGKKR